MSKNKFINQVDTISDEILEGAALVLGDYIDVKGHIVMRKGLLDDPNPTVTVMTLGGAGHEPSSLGFCGVGWEHLKVIGDIFAAPGPETVLEGIRLANRGKGVFFYVGNHAGDIMSAKMAVKMARKEGINLEMAVMYDDCSTFPRSEREQRRNLCCAPTLSKILGSAAAAGYGLAELKDLTDRYMDQVASLAVANRGATHPATGLPISVIPEGELVVGMGHHGEGAKNSTPMMTSREIVDTMASQIINDIGLTAGDDVLVTINGSGSTTYMELMILYKDTVHFLEERGIHVHDKIVGEYITTQEQAGFIMSMVRVDEEMKRLFDAPCRTAFVTKF